MRVSGSYRPTQIEPVSEPWQRLQDLIAERHAADILPYLSSLAPGEVARAVSRLSAADVTTMLELLEPEDAADLLELLPDAQVSEIIEELPVQQAAEIVEELPGNEQADLLGELSEGDAEAILEHMEPSVATSARQLLSYAPDSAGGVMTNEYLAYREQLTVGDVLADMRAHGERYSDYEIQYAYIVAADGRLVGVLRLRDLVLSPHDAAVTRIMVRDPLSVPDHMPLEDLKQFFDEQPFIGVPVVDRSDRLVGVVRRAAMEQALGVRATRTFLQIAGLIGEEELRTMPTLRRSYRRLSWLSLNIVLNVIAASVIAFYQDTLSAVIALAVFLPIISDMSGCSGNQAVAVSIRELTLGLIRPYELVRVLAKESTVGLINGLVLGVLLGTLAFVWKGNVFLGLVVGVALTLNTLLAVLLGGLIPLALKWFRLDPALASGPILTTVTDMCGFFLVLSFASVVLARLV